VLAITVGGLTFIIGPSAADLSSLAGCSSVVPISSLPLERPGRCCSRQGSCALTFSRPRTSSASIRGWAFATFWKRKMTAISRWERDQSTVERLVLARSRFPRQIRFDFRFGPGGFAPQSRPFSEVAVEPWSASDSNKTPAGYRRNQLPKHFRERSAPHPEARWAVRGSSFVSRGSAGRRGPRSCGLMRLSPAP
jgi:hypothetical protein